MSTIDPDKTQELKALLGELKMLSSRTALALSKPTLLVEVIGWAMAIETIMGRLAALNLDYESTLTTMVTMPDEVAGQVVVHDLDKFRIPDFVPEEM